MKAPGVGDRAPTFFSLIYFRIPPPRFSAGPHALSTPSSACRFRHGPRGREAGQTTTSEASADLGEPAIELILKKPLESTGRLQSAEDSDVKS
mmetsp:Transcript_32817/g.101679  ORF Transcript_32817/g.101679 Transcript_32817/m.101679 type:complete len:93 (-) Transcript_32817:277-555(-)